MKALLCLLFLFMPVSAFAIELSIPEMKKDYGKLIHVESTTMKQYMDKTEAIYYSGLVFDSPTHTTFVDCVIDVKGRSAVIKNVVRLTKN